MAKDSLNDNRGNIESLNELSKAPHCSRKSKIDLRIKDFIQNFRAEHPRAGRIKIKPELDEFWQDFWLEYTENSFLKFIIGDECYEKVGLKKSKNFSAFFKY